jgi:hypothetical protein
MKMKSAVCDDNDHDSCSGKFYNYDGISRKKIMVLGGISREPLSIAICFGKRFHSWHGDLVNTRIFVTYGCSMLGCIIPKYGYRYCRNVIFR